MRSTVGTTLRAARRVLRPGTGRPTRLVWSAAPRARRRRGEVWVLTTAPADGPRTEALLAHWSAQGVRHLVVADLEEDAAVAQRLRHPPPGLTVLVGTGVPATTPRPALLDALARRARLAGADWVVAAGPDDRGFAPGADVREFLAGSGADVVPVQRLDAVPADRGWLLDSTRVVDTPPAFRTHRLARVGTDGRTVDRPGTRADAPLVLVREQAAGHRPQGPVVEVDLASWDRWDPQGLLEDPVVVRSAQVPGAGAARQRRPGEVRRRPRTVIDPPPWMGFGNLLYLLLSAHDRQGAGEDCRVLNTPTLARWQAELGTLAPLCVERGDLRRRDRREDPLLRTYGAFGLDFDRAALTDFVRTRLLASPVLAPARLRDAPPDEVVVNVRRGDYYSVPEHRATYGFDQVAYVRAAMALAQQRAPVRTVRVVSDGPDWCRSRLGWLGEHHEVVLAAREDGPVADFVGVASARRLVLANSTFSYWAAHVSNVLHGDNHADTVAPWFFSRAEAGGRAYQVDPRWRLVDDIEGGWHGSLGEVGSPQA